MLTLRDFASLSSCWLAALLVAQSLWSCAHMPAAKQSNLNDQHDDWLELRTEESPADYYSSAAEEFSDGSLAKPIRAMLGRVLPGWGYEPPRGDGRLCAAARALARMANNGQPPPYAAIAFTMADLGLIEPSPHLFVLRTDLSSVENAPNALATAFEQRLASMPPTAYHRFGVGVAAEMGGTATIVLLLAEGHVEIEPVARAAKANATTRLKARLLDDFHSGKIFITDARGHVSEISNGGGKSTVDGTFKCPHEPGRWQIEILAEGPLGPTVLANFPLWCGLVPPTTIRLPVPRFAKQQSPKAVERQLLRLVNEDRAAHGLPTIAWSVPAANVARGHSMDMEEQGFVGHVSPTTGSPLARAQAANLRSGLLLENVARAYSAEEAHAGLMNSPGHRANILHKDITHAGIGVVAGRLDAERPEIYVTQVFVRVPPAINPADAQKHVFAAVNSMRRELGLSQLKTDAKLQAIAQRHAAKMAKQGIDRPAVGDDLNEATGRYARIFSVSHIIMAADQLSNTGLTEPRLTHLGVGVGQGNHESVGDNAWFVVLHLAQGD